MKKPRKSMAPVVMPTWKTNSDISPPAGMICVTGMRMVAASKGLIVAADKGGKSKTVTQLIALGCFLGASMASKDWSRLFHVDLTEFALWVSRTGRLAFVVGTVLAVWSGWRYISRHRAVVFSEGNP